MMGDVPTALASLEEVLASPGLPGMDVVCIALLKSEILYLDDREHDALQVFREHIDARLEHLPPDHALILSDNRHMLSTFLERTSGRDFYFTVDARRIANVDLWDASTLLEATEAADEDKHFQALPLVWGEYLRAYRTGSWRSLLVTGRHLAQEFLRLHALDEAALQAAIARDDKLAKKIGDELVSSLDRELIQKTIEKLLRFTNLSKHARGTAEILKCIADVLPNGQVNSIFEWLLTRAGTLPDDWATSNSLKAIWEALRAVAFRLNAEQAERLVRAAVSHRLWRERQSIHREIMLESLHRVVDKLDSDTLRFLAAAVIPVVTEFRDDRDYIEAINLACAVAEHLSLGDRAPLAQALYPAGAELNLVLMQIADIFGHNLQAPVLASFARESAEKIRRQVERLPANEQAKSIPGMMGYVTAPQGDTKVVVHQGGGLIYGAVRHLRHSFTSESLEEIAEAMVRMIEERENLLHNKRALIDCLGDLADCLSADTRSRVVKTIEPLASGSKIVEPTIVRTSAVVNHPLNPFRVHTGSPGELRRSALEALAKIESIDPGSSSIFGDAIEAALIADDVETRRAGFAAAQEVAVASRALLTALLMGTRDSDGEVRVRAIDALAAQKDLALSEIEWQLLLHSLRLAVQSKERRVRRAVAESLADLQAKAPTGSTPSFETMIDTLRSDTCFSVRRVFEPAPTQASRAA
jgi:hypothetical protein